MRVAHSTRGCNDDGTFKQACRGKDDCCSANPSFKFDSEEDYELCLDSFAKLEPACKGKKWGIASNFDTAGGTYYGNCMSWTIVAINS